MSGNKMKLETPHDHIHEAQIIAAGEDDIKNGKEFELKVSEHTTADAIDHWPREMCEYVDDRFNGILKRQIELLFGNLTEEQQNKLFLAAIARRRAAFNMTPDQYPLIAAAVKRELCPSIDKFTPAQFQILELWLANPIVTEYDESASGRRGVQN